jgi:hypothetical protein
MRGRAGLAGEPPGRGAAGPRTGEGPLTDQEYLWEPAPGAWSLRPGHEPPAVGAGRVAARRRPRRPRPDPVTTIAWRLGHLHVDFARNWEWTVGGRHQPPEQLVDFSPSAAVGAGAVWATMDRWRDSVAALTGEQLDTVGYSQYPWSDAAELPFITVIWAGNLEFIHHMAEIALGASKAISLGR